MTENIQKFLRPPSEGGAYTDEKLAALLAHAQDGKLSHASCCCLAGIPSAAHPLHGFMEFDYEGDHQSQGFTTISMEFAALGREHLGMDRKEQDALRRERLIPLILAEMERRAKPPNEDEEDETESDEQPIGDYEDGLSRHGQHGYSR